MDESNTQQDEATSSETTTAILDADSEAPLVAFQAKHEGPAKRYTASDKSTSELCGAILSWSERESQANGVTEQ
ncbi:hypothetical protein EKH57_08895 [Halorubrum sp. BOL3-1]|uniref:hypothetical protein n=1 Tax=Halorubrum sp. BOL3-1 TaxID=2497325 RepID=UPI001004FDF6|nr:hypothetical protein [Halorubrum sp. BOL3-1]QAU12834.1 hypothetical protein EKH57_08895 [Halorubrum sp. BOL3-1]